MKAPRTSSFDHKAKTWDQQVYRQERARVIAQAILGQVPSNSSDEVLDFGSGTGLLGFEFLDRARRVTFADTSLGMLDQVRTKALEKDLDNFETVHLPQGSLGRTYNLIVSLMVLHHIEDHGSVIADLATRLAPGGSLCLSDLDQDDGRFHTDEQVPHNGFDREEIASILRNCDLDIVTSTTGFVNRKVVEGREVEFPIFLIIGRKPRP